MGALGDAERQDLRELRDRLVARIEYLEDQESYGTITEEEKRAVLASEYGDDYKETLIFLNDVLHRTNKRHKTVPHIREAATITYLILAITIIAGLLWPGITGGVTDTNTLLLNKTLPADTPIILALPTRIIIEEVTISEEATITLTDATGTHNLVHEGRCEVCGTELQPPYMLRATATTTINTLTYRSTH